MATLKSMSTSMDDRSCPNCGAIGKSKSKCVRCGKVYCDACRPSSITCPCDAGASSGKRGGKSSGGSGIIGFFGNAIKSEKRMASENPEGYRAMKQEERKTDAHNLKVAAIIVAVVVGLFLLYHIAEGIYNAVNDSLPGVTRALEKDDYEKAMQIYNSKRSNYKAVNLIEDYKDSMIDGFLAENEFDKALTITNTLDTRKWGETENDITRIILAEVSYQIAQSNPQGIVSTAVKFTQLFQQSFYADEGLVKAVPLVASAGYQKEAERIAKLIEDEEKKTQALEQIEILLE